MSDSLMALDLGLRDAARVCGLPPSTLASWVVRDKLTGLDAFEHGSTGNHRFTVADLIQIALVSNLAGFGIPLNQADDIAREAIKKVCRPQSLLKLSRAKMEKVFNNQILLVTRESHGMYEHAFLFSDEFWNGKEERYKRTCLMVDLDNLVKDTIDSLAELVDEAEQACA